MPQNQYKKWWMLSVKEECWASKLAERFDRGAALMATSNAKLDISVNHWSDRETWTKRLSEWRAKNAHTISDLRFGAIFNAIPFPSVSNDPAAGGISVLAVKLSRSDRIRLQLEKR